MMGSCSRVSDFPVSPEYYSAEPMFDEGFQKHQREETGYGVWLEKEAGSFCHPSQD